MESAPGTGSRDQGRHRRLCFTVLFSIMADKITRIAIVDDNRCKPKRCAQECKKVRLASPSSVGSRPKKSNRLYDSHVQLSKWVGYSSSPNHVPSLNVLPVVQVNSVSR